MNDDARKRFGRYYTPRPVARGLYRLLLDALSTEKLDPATCTLLDPACGDGAILAAPEASGFRRLVGLDLDAEALRAAREKARPGSVLIEGDAYGEGLSALTREVSGSGPLVVVGNPPYVGTSELLRSGRYHATRDALLPFAREVAKGTSIRDDYVLFFGVADRLIEAAGGRGAIAFVTSASFVDNFLYAPMRRWLLSRYRLHALVECGGQLFEGTRVAVALSVWVRADGEAHRPFLHARLSGSVEERLAELDRGPDLSPATPQGEALLLNAPSSQVADQLAQLRAAGDPIGSVLRVSFPGLKTRFDELLVADGRELLAERMRDFFSASDPRAFADRHGIPERAFGKLEQAFAARSRTSFSEEAIRPFARYAGTPHRFRIPPEAMAFAYLDRELIPRGDHRLQGSWDPHRAGPKLVFNAREVPLSAAVVEGPVCVHDYRHSRFAPLRIPLSIAEGARPREDDFAFETLNLSRSWSEAARLLREPADVFYFACAVYDSRLIQELFAPVAGASEEVPIPRISAENARQVQAIADEARALSAGGALGEDGERMVRELFGI